MSSDSHNQRDLSRKMLGQGSQTSVHCETLCLYNITCANHSETPIYSAGPHKDLEWYLQLRIYTSQLNEQLLEIETCICINRSTKSIRIQFQIFKICYNDKLVLIQSSTVFLKPLEHRWLPTYTEVASLEVLKEKKLKLHCNISVTYDVVSFEYGMLQLVNDLESHFLDQKYCDIFLQVNEKKIPAHKIILASRSPVFAAMFEHDMKEKRTSVVDIEDIDDKTLHNFLLFLYTGRFKLLEEVTFEWKAVGNLLTAADKYDVPSLKELCADYMEQNLSVDNACEILSLAHIHNVCGLKKCAMEFINVNVDRLIDSQSWNETLKQSPTLIADLYVAKFRKSDI